MRGLVELVVPASKASVYDRQQPTVLCFERLRPDTDLRAGGGLQTTSQAAADSSAVCTGNACTSCLRTSGILVTHCKIAVTTTHSRTYRVWYGLCAAMGW